MLHASGAGLRNRHGVKNEYLRLKPCRKNHTFLTTACGSLCSTCAVKKPQVFCANCEAGRVDEGFHDDKT